MQFTISKGLIKAWLRKLIRHGILVAPFRLKGGDVIFKEAFTPDNIDMDFKQPFFSVKSFFLPQEETLFTFKDRSVKTMEELFDEYPRIFFGLRPCDVRSIIQADRFFGGNYQDPYYKSRRENTLLITVACNSPENHCFCHLMGVEPFSGDGADIFMIELNNEFAVSPRTPRGEIAISDFQYFFEIADEQQKQEVIKKQQRARQKLEENIPQKVLSSPYGLIDDNFLQQISSRCFSCGSCSYICPMCFCYNVVDRENRLKEGQRVRQWDSCIFEGFTRMAGRHNLLKSKQDRLRKRFTHKLQQYQEVYGIPGCTGCGRCTVTCLGKIGMLDILKLLSGEVSLNEDK